MPSGQAKPLTPCFESANRRFVPVGVSPRRPDAFAGYGSTAPYRAAKLAATANPSQRRPSCQGLNAGFPQTSGSRSKDCASQSVYRQMRCGTTRCGLARPRYQDGSGLAESAANGGDGLQIRRLTPTEVECGSGVRRMGDLSVANTPPTRLTLASPRRLGARHAADTTALATRPASPEPGRLGTVPLTPRRRLTDHPRSLRRHRNWRHTEIGSGPGTYPYSPGVGRLFDSLMLWAWQLAPSWLPHCRGRWPDSGKQGRKPSLSGPTVPE